MVHIKTSKALGLDQSLIYNSAVWNISQWRAISSINFLKCILGSYIKKKVGIGLIMHWHSPLLPFIKELCTVMHVVVFKKSASTYTLGEIFLNQYISLLLFKTDKYWFEQNQCAYLCTEISISHMTSCRPSSPEHTINFGLEFPSKGKLWVLSQN